MSNEVELCQRLQRIWDQDFPLSQAMGLQVERFQDHRLSTRAELSPNRNVHGSAFAGSLYAIEALTAWGLLYLELASRDLKASIIHGEGHIAFAKPIEEDIVAVSSFEGHQSAIDYFLEHGKARMELTTEVHIASGVASRFSGSYYLRAE